MQPPWCYQLCLRQITKLSRHFLLLYIRKRYGVLVLDRPGADPAVGLPKADGVVVSGRGQNNRVAAHRPLVHVHAWAAGRQSLS